MFISMNFSSHGTYIYHTKYNNNNNKNNNIFIGMAVYIYGVT